MSHDWISFKFQLGKGLILGRGDWDSALGCWLGQPLILGAVLFIINLMALWSDMRKFNQDHRFAYLVLLTVIPMLIFGLAALTGKY